MMMQLINQPFSACKFPRSARVLKVVVQAAARLMSAPPSSCVEGLGGWCRGCKHAGRGVQEAAASYCRGLQGGGIYKCRRCKHRNCRVSTWNPERDGEIFGTRGGGLPRWQVSVAFEQKSSAKLFELGRWMRVCLLLLVLLHAPTCECRKHRYGRVASKVASRSRNAVMVTAPRETVVVDGVIYQRRDELAVSEGSLDGSTLQAVQRSLQRARRRTLAPAPALMETEPYVMLGGLFVATQLFS